MLKAATYLLSYSLNRNNHRNNYRYNNHRNNHTVIIKNKKIKTVNVFYNFL